jgi:mannosyl-oligosaccharide alpha-1,2-mannosidase
VDTLTAAILLEVPEIIKTALFHIEKIDWDIVTSPKVAIFGSTIRYLGAMLSGLLLLLNPSITYTDQ